MKKIYKYPLTDIQSVVLPKGAQVLKVGMQGDQMMIWAMVDENPAEFIERKFEVLGTGDSFDYDKKNYRYIDSIFDRPFVWHVFEINE